MERVRKADPGDAIPMVPTRDVVHAHAHLLEQLREELRHTRDQFAQLIAPTVDRLAGWLHLLPASEEHHHSEVGGAFRHALEVALEALRLAYTKDLGELAQQNRMEIVERQRVALCMASLVHDAGKPITDLTVVAPQGQWAPLLEPLATWAQREGVREYSIRWVPGRHKAHERFTLLGAQRLIAEDALSYIHGAGPQALLRMWDAACGGPDDRALLTQLVKEADHRVSLADLASHRSQRKGGVTGHKAARLLSVAKERIAGQQWPVNRPGSFVYLTDRGAFLIWPAAMEPLLAAARDRGDTGYPADPEELANWFVERRLAGPFFDPATRTTRNLTPLAPACLRTRLGAATVLRGLLIQDPADLFGDTLPEIEPDLWSEVQSGRVPAPGVVVARSPQAVASPASSTPAQGAGTDAAAASPPEAPGTPASQTASAAGDSKAKAPSEASAQAAQQAAGEKAGIDPAAQDAIESGTSWLRSDTSKGRVLVREIVYRFAKPQDSGLTWLTDGGLWRGRVVVAWPEAIAGMGFEEGSALKALIEHGVLHHEPMNKDQGWVHSVALGEGRRQVIAFNEVTSQILRPLLDHYGAKAESRNRPKGGSSAAASTADEVTAVQRQVVQFMRLQGMEQISAADINGMLATKLQVRARVLISAVTLGEPPLLTKAADGVTYQRCADHPAWAEA